MCRYAYKTYKTHFACFECRKVFKKTPIEDYLKQQGNDFTYWQLVKFNRVLRLCESLLAHFKKWRDSDPIVKKEWKSRILKNFLENSVGKV